LKWFFVQAQLQIGPVLHPGCAFQFMELEFGDNFIAPVLKLFCRSIKKFQSGFLFWSEMMPYIPALQSGIIAGELRNQQRVRGTEVVVQSRNSTTSHLLSAACILWPLAMGKRKRGLFANCKVVQHPKEMFK
jgi:hypothetical protein